MQLISELTQKDFIESIIAHRNHNSVTKWSLRLLTSILLLFIALGLLLLIVRRDAQSIMPMLVVAAGWSLFIWGMPWLSARTQFSKQPSAQGQRMLEVDSAGVHWKWNGGASDMEWRSFIRCLESKDHFLLYSSPKCFNTVPKRAFTPEQSAEFRSLVKHNIPGS